MAKYVPTDDQQAIIDHRGSALLVSAAAGSGKTKVLVERILRQVCDPVSPCNLDDFLIITYTKAAAAELRSRIAAEIGARLAEDSSNRHLRNQLTRIYLAEISTVHSFCSTILREYAYLLDIPADFRVAETAECEELRQKAVEQVMQQLYEGLESRPEVVSLLDELGRGRDDRRLIALILAAYDKIQCHADPEQWTAVCRDAISCDGIENVSDTIWAKYLIDDTVTFLQQQLQRVRHAKNLVLGCGDLAKYVPVFSDDEALFDRLLKSPTWETFHSADVSFARLPTIRNCQAPELQNEVKNIRDIYKKKLTASLKRFSCDGHTALSDLKKTGRALLGLLSVVEEFRDRFSALKRQRRVLDFSDLEHHAIRLLTDRYTKAPTATAKEIGARYREILVDEYQDSNRVQDTIFRAISRNGENLFMVGDVKQSIYSFRLADPGIFLEKYHDYQTMDAPDGKTPRKILLSTNFRSGKAILDAVNHVFATVMSEQVGDLTYGEDESLRTIREFPPMGEPAVELHCIESSSDADDQDGVKKQEVEARFVAQKIRELMDGEHYITDDDGLRRIRPEDIVILMRSVSTNASIFMNALAQQGIAATCDRTESILETTEVSTLLAWLQIIDNPHQDIPLVTAMAGPLGGFSADDLANLRLKNKRSDLYDALLLAAEDGEPYSGFLSLLQELRDIRRWATPTEFFDMVCSRVHAFEIFGAMTDGVGRTENLNTLRSLYHTTLSNGKTTLSSFLRHVEHLRENQVSIGVDSTSKSSSGVTIMTVHKSKGLEFPVVFLCDLSRKFNVTDLSEPVLMDQQLLMGSNVFDSNLMLQYPGIAKNAIAVKKKRDMLSEEMRVLYVAMTRAMDRLIMTYCGAGIENQLQKVASTASYPLQPGVSGDVQCPGQWLLYAASVRPEAGHLFGGAPIVTDLPGEAWLVRYHSAIVAQDIAVKIADQAETQNTEQEFNCLDHTYAYSNAVSVPAKLTATQIKGRGLDAESSQQASQEVIYRRPLVKPRTFHPKKQDLTAAQKGIAVHLFMQYCRYENCLTLEGIAREKQRLMDKAFLSPAQIEAVSEEKILRFFQSDYGRLIAQSKDVHREFKFSLLVDAGKYYPSATGEEIMLQGVIDCFVVTADGILVLDFKTDGVRPGEEAIRTEHYKPQLMAYSSALERIYGCPVMKRIIYYFSTDTFVEL